MPNIDTLLGNIMAAKYGEAVRSSIHDAIEEINEVVENWESGLMDTTLTSEALPAQGKAVGGALRAYGESCRTYDGMLYLEWQKGGIYNGDGSDYVNPNEKTNYISVSGGKKYMILNPNGKSYKLFEYNSSKTFLPNRTEATDTYRILMTKATTAYIRVMIESNPSNIDDVAGFAIIEMDSGYVPKSAGNITSGVYSSLSELPLGTIVSINSAVINAMSDTPIPNSTSGANVITLAGNNTNRGGSIQIVVYWTGDAFFRGYNSAYQPWEKISLVGKENGRYIIPVGFYTDNNTYPSYDSLPQNTMACFNRATANAMTDTPLQFTTGVFVETLSPNHDSRNGGFQKITDWYGSTICIRTFISNQWRPWSIFRNEIVREYTVGQGKDFSTLTSCLNAIRQNWIHGAQKFRVFVDAGTYDMTDVISYINNNTITAAGFILPPNTEIIGKGKTKTKLVLNYTGTNDTIRSQLSPINIPYGGKLKGLSIVVKNIRYAVHTDTDVLSLGSTFMYNNKIEFEDLYLEHQGFDAGVSPTYKAPASFGMGIWSGQKRTFKDCIFVGNQFCGWLCHNQTSFENPAEISFENCDFISHLDGIPQFSSERVGASFISWGAPVVTRVTMNNCRTNRCVGMYQNLSNPDDITCDYYLSADNDIFVMQTNVNDANKEDTYVTGDCVRRILTGESAIDAYTPVGYDALTLCTGDLSNSQFRGILLHDTESGESATIQYKGLIYSPWINLHASSVGKSYNWNGSTWVETTDEHPFVKVLQERVAIINP